MIYLSVNTLHLPLGLSCKSLLTEEIVKMTHFEKCEFILNGFDVTYTPKWEEFYTAVLDIICYIKKEYERML